MKPWFGRVVHDLKGPLAPLQTAVYLLRGEQLPPARQKELLDVLDRQTRRLNAMLGELGDWGRAEGGLVASSRTPTPLPVLVDLALGGLPACVIEPVYADGCDALDVPGEQSALVELLGALLAHACARDPAQAPTLDAHREGERVVLRVRDHGRALPLAERATLFDEPLRQPADEGLGLRLVTAAAVARRHGGQLRIDDTGDTGLCVRCELPLSP